MKSAMLAMLVFVWVCSVIESLDCKQNVGSRVVSVLIWLLSSALIVLLMNLL